jgi:carbonic anhydrase
VDNTLAVVGVFFDSVQGGSQANPLIDALNIDKLKGNVTKIINPSVPMMQMIKGLNTDKQNLYLYKGSLTTPPCSEIVTWLIINSP